MDLFLLRGVTSDGEQNTRFLGTVTAQLSEAARQVSGGADLDAVADLDEVHKVMLAANTVELRVPFAITPSISGGRGEPLIPLIVHMKPYGQSVTDAERDRDIGPSGGFAVG